ncbi:class I SAM-dependent methyltransferase [Salinimicrobium flavum]|uniref:Class I SAM-dependent methyltransferase n=1 Tax=Salinimicrobium flavum TaxID=1737065 RepID=A0ABW5IVG1_9FLAO
MICTLCDGHLPKKIDPEYYECLTCGALVKDRLLHPGQEEEKGRYLEHRNDVNDPRYREFTSPIWRYVLDNFRPEDRGLDFGSGTGPVISKVLSEHGYKVEKYDPYFAPHPHLLEQKYNYIVSCEVIEHFYNPKKEFSLLKKMLKPNGQLICMTLLFPPEKDFGSWIYRKDPTHVFIYREKTMKHITRQFNFNSCEISNGRLIIWK